MNSAQVQEVTRRLRKIDEAVTDVMQLIGAYSGRTLSYNEVVAYLHAYHHIMVCSDVPYNGRVEHYVSTPASAVDILSEKLGVQVVDIHTPIVDLEEGIEAANDWTSERAAIEGPSW